MSTLRVGNITATGGTGTITVPTGNQISQVDAPAGLVLIKTQTIGTAVSSVEVTSAFSGDYDNYRIDICGTGTTSTNTDGTLTFGSTTSGYLWGTNAVSTASGVANVGASGSNIDYVSAGETTYHMGIIEVSNPFLATRTLVRASSYSVSSLNTRTTIGLVNNNTSYTSFTISVKAGTMTGGIIRVYGYRN